MKKYNIGIIGYGGFGKFLHHWWNKIENVQVVAISDHRDCTELGGLKHYRNYSDLMADKEVDIISIATPPSLHTDLACEAMQHGKHVLLEKPIALTKEGAEKIMAVQQETGMVAAVDHMLRYNPIVKALKELSLGERFGKLRHVTVNNYAQDEGLPKEHWFWDKSVSGGIFIEHGVHFFDIINALTAQKVIKVTGSAHNRNELQQDQVSATVVYDGGLIANHYHSFSGPGFFEQTTIRLTYDLARIEVEGWIPMKGTIEALVNEDTLAQLNDLPGLAVDNITPISEVADVSRPEGWGSAAPDGGNTLSAGGIAYSVGKMVTGNFEIHQSKAEVYGLCVKDILKDLIQKIENPEHQLQVTPQDAYESLKVAISADQSADLKL